MAFTNHSKNTGAFLNSQWAGFGVLLMETADELFLENGNSIRLDQENGATFSNLAKT